MRLTETDAVRHIPLHREKDFSERVSGHKDGRRGEGGEGGEGCPHIAPLSGGLGSAPLGSQAEPGKATTSAVP